MNNFYRRLKHPFRRGAWTRSLSLSLSLFCPSKSKRDPQQRHTCKCTRTHVNWKTTTRRPVPSELMWEHPNQRYTTRHVAGNENQRLPFHLQVKKNIPKVVGIAMMIIIFLYGDPQTPNTTITLTYLLLWRPLPTCIACLSIIHHHFQYNHLFRYL